MQLSAKGRPAEERYCTEHNGSDVTRNRGCLVREINGFVTVTYKPSESKKL